jgi:hypothetical protein
MGIPSTDVARSERPGDVPGPPLSLSEIGSLLLRHYGVHEGFYEVTVEFQLAVGGIGPDPNNIYPSAIVGVSKIGLRRIPEGKPGPGLVDAAEVNPPARAKAGTVKAKAVRPRKATA